MNEQQDDGPASGPCVIELLQGEHEALRELLARLDGGGPPEHKQYVLDEIEGLFREHNRVEELVVARARRSLGGGAALLEAARRGDGDLGDGLRMLARMVPWDREYDEHLSGVVGHLRAHLQWEEEHLFPSLRRALSPEERRSLAVEALRVQQRRPTPLPFAAPAGRDAQARRAT